MADNNDKNRTTKLVNETGTSPVRGAKPPENKPKTKASLISPRKDRRSNSSFGSPKGSR